jgi:hypothetical protein
VRHHHHRGQLGSRNSSGTLLFESVALSQLEADRTRRRPSARTFFLLSALPRVLLMRLSPLLRRAHTLTHCRFDFCVGRLDWCAGAGSAESGAQLRARVRRKGVSTHACTRISHAQRLEQKQMAGQPWRQGAEANCVRESIDSTAPSPDCAPSRICFCLFCCACAGGVSMTCSRRCGATYERQLHRNELARRAERRIVRNSFDSPLFFSFFDVLSYFFSST